MVGPEQGRTQPGLTIVDPLVASTLGVVLFGERLNHAPVAFIGEILAVALLVASVVALSRSPLVRDEKGEEPDEKGEEPAGALLPAELVGTNEWTRAVAPGSNPVGLPRASWRSQARERPDAVRACQERSSRS